MAIVIYNTLSRKKDTFISISPGKAYMYVCGPTVYDSSHIGHARSAVVFDVVFRYLEKSGYTVTYVRNFTDVDDKIIARARELGQEPAAISTRYIAEYHEDMDALNVRRPTFEPKATETIPEIIALVNRLLEKGNAYVLDGDVYFRVESFRGYGKLSGRRLSDMEAGARVDVNEKKENPFDFALWKAAKPGEPFWESPWGHGRPGWHIECSAMGGKFLGESFDIHGGGKDLIFPHHENEIAQSEAATGKSFVRFWMHNGFVNINSEKMSKSLGNFRTIREILQTRHPETVRLFLLSKHYRSPVDFTEDALNDAASAVERVYNFLGQVENTLEPVPGPGRSATRERFAAEMDDDFNTAAALGVLFEAVREGNRLLDEGKKQEALEVYQDIKNMAFVLGIFEKSARQYLEGKTARATEKQGLDPAQVEALIAQRTQARKEKNWAQADRIRDELADMGVLIQDGPSDTSWKMK